MADIIQTFPSGGAGGGHTILDTDGQAVAQESKLQFNGLSVADDSTNGVTEIEGEGLNQDSLDDIAGAQILVPAVIIGDANNYSTTEKVIGKWINGKPIYQRTWTGLDVSTAYNSWTNIVRIPNISLIIDVKAYGLDSTNHSLLPAALEFAVQSTDYIATEANTSINLRVIKMITVQYTKTID